MDLVYISGGVPSGPRRPTASMGFSMIEQMPASPSRGTGTSRGWRCALAFLLMLASLATAGCATRPGAGTLVPTRAAATPGAKLITVLAATDRAPEGPGEVGYGTGRAGLRYEELTVSLPPGHRTGAIEWTQDASSDPAESFVVTRRVKLDENAFRARLASQVAGSDDGTAALFVHGYNYTFTEALFRLAQLSSDAPGAGIPVLFSWPSEAVVAGYVADRDAVAYARDDLAHVLGMVGGLETKNKILLAGHSMGAWLTMETLRQLRLEKRDRLVSRFEVVLAAPDIDIDVFRSQLAVVGPLVPPLTILVSKDDRALDMSRRLTGGRQRAGAVDVNDPLLEEIAEREDLRIVDISSVEASDGARHDRFVRFAAFRSRAMVGNGSAAGSLQRAGAYVFNAAGAAVASPFTLAGRVIGGQ